MTAFLIYLIGVVLAVVLGFVFFILIRRHEKVGNLLESRLILVRLPKEEKKEVDPKKEIGLSEQLFSLLAGLKHPASLEVAVSHVGEEIHFYLSVHRSEVEFVKRQIQGLWSGAEVSETDDYTVFNPQGVSVGAYLGLKQNYAIPIRTYDEANLDTFTTIISNLSKLNEAGEGAALQVIFQAAPGSSRSFISGVIGKLKKGTPAKEVFGGGKGVVKEFQSALATTKSEKEPKEKVIDEELIKSIQKKVSKPLLQVNFRLVSSAVSQLSANGILDSLAGSFSQFAAPTRNEFKITAAKNARKFNFNFIFRKFDPAQAMILNTEELVSIFHLPGPTLAGVPRIQWLKSKEAAPPANLPNEGVLIGESVFRGQKKPVYLRYEDRERHLYVIGQTGTGKSTFLKNLIAQDIQNGEGVAVLDPHGDLVNHILGLVPESRAKDVILFDPSDITNPMGLNMLEFNPIRPEEKTFIVNEMQSIFNKLFSQETMGPMFEQYMRNALLLLMEDFANEPATLIEVPRVFTDTEWRKKKLARIVNPVLTDFWEKEAAKVGGEASIQNMTPYITSKFNNFIANDYLRPIIGQPKSAFNFREVLDGGKILLVNLAKGRLGDINSNLLGMIITGKILMAALSRTDVPDPENRRRFHLFIDEFQNFTTDSISVILSEARKYKLTLNIAHQFIAQLSEDIRDSVFGNVGSIVSFRVGVQDAEFLVKQFEPTFSVNDLINIDNFNAHIKMLINGAPSVPFNIKTVAPHAGDLARSEQIRALSRTTYTRPRADVEVEIYKRLRNE